MPRIDTEAFYRTAMTKYGNTAEGVHWNSTYSQERRFAMLREFLPASLTDTVLVDVGCGFGDLYCYLKRHHDLPGRYIGIDLLPAMVKIAHQRTGCEILYRDVLVDELPVADYYVCSGAMNILTRMETYCFIKRCFKASRFSFVFNLLWGDDESEVFNYRHPDEIWAWSQTLAAARVWLRDHYLPGDFSMALEHDHCVDSIFVSRYAETDLVARHAKMQSSLPLMNV
jgi:SAM-dependent methyltransferase